MDGCRYECMCSAACKTRYRFICTLLKAGIQFTIGVGFGA